MRLAGKRCLSIKAHLIPLPADCVEKIPNSKSCGPSTQTHVQRKSDRNIDQTGRGGSAAADAEFGRPSRQNLPIGLHGKKSFLSDRKLGFFNRIGPQRTLVQSAANGESEPFAVFDLSGKL
jgi:hypothetical protein